MTRIAALALAVLALLAIAGTASPATARAATLVGIGDQDPSAFGQATFQQLRIKRTRVFVPWNVALKRRDRNNFGAWLATVRAARVEPLVHFSAASGSQCPRRPCRLPSVRAYKKAFRAFRRRYRSVRVIGVWNEANHRSQPTFRNPRRAAQFYNVVRRYCRGCKIVAADVIDEANMIRWLKVFRRYARRPRIFGLHNYRDSNPRRGQRLGGTRRLVRYLGRKQIWITETGGIVKFRLPSNRTLFRFDPRRASRAVGRAFRIAKRYRRRVKRLYLYSFKAPLPTNRFDAGLVDFNGTPRPGYQTVRRQLATRTFRP